MVKVSQKKRKSALGKGVFYGFIPHVLAIKGQPELDNFPLNILFARFGIRDGERVMGSALYEPDFSTFKKRGTKYSMVYRNIYGGNCELNISYNSEKNSWRGDKYVNTQWVGGAVGSEWKGFFIHFTFLGLSNGERCLFDRCDV